MPDTTDSGEIITLAERLLDEVTSERRDWAKVEQAARTLSAAARDQQVHDISDLLNMSDPEQIVGLLRTGRAAAAVETLEAEAHLHEAALNQEAADALYALAEQIGGTP